MVHPGFGETINCSDAIEELLNIAPLMCSTDTKLLLTDKYDSVYGICNHSLLDATRPLSIVGMHPAEGTDVGSTIYERIEQFATLQVGKFFNISLTEFLEYPRDIVIHILEVAYKMQPKETNAASELLDKLSGN